MMDKQQQRRSLLKKSLLGLGAGLMAAPAIAEMCVGITPDQDEGPFYPVSEKLDTDNDLTYRTDKTEKALGTVIFVNGVVADEDCNPIEGALVEIWQACDTGKYDHPGDPNPAAIDPNFQYFGRCLTNANGEYVFKTIRPGTYPAGQNWVRPAHIHYKVHRKGYEEFITQMYFSDDPLNAKDYILQALPKSEQAKLVVDFSLATVENAPSGKFDLTLKKIKSPF